MCARLIALVPALAAWALSTRTAHIVGWGGGGCGFTTYGALIAPVGNPGPVPGCCSSESTHGSVLLTEPGVQTEINMNVRSGGRVRSRLDQVLSLFALYSSVSCCCRASRRGLNILPVLFHHVRPPLSSLSLQLLSFYTHSSPHAPSLLLLLPILRRCSFVF